MKKTTVGKSPWESSLAQPWIEASGREGDFYRRTLINPILAYLLDQNAANFSAGILQHAACSLLRNTPNCLYSFDVPRDAHGEPAKNWLPIFDANAHSQWMRNSPSKPTVPDAILDLGCGTGYRGSWLGERGYEYLGIDLSRKLVEYAQKKCKHPQADYQICDLDSPAANERLTTIYGSGKLQIPKWIFAITIFDHLRRESIKSLLETLTQIQGISSCATMLAITCNPQFYDAIPDTEALVHAQLESVGDGANASTSVEIFHRSRTAYSRIFRDAGITILDHLTPQPLVNFRDGSIHNKAVGPFCFWLLRIGGRARTPISSSTAKDRLRERRDGKQSDAAIALANVLDDKAVCHELTVGAGEAIISAHNMGGRLFVVQRGSATFGAPLAKPVERKITATARKAIPLIPLEVASRIHFDSGDVFGDLELGKGSALEDRSTYYRESVSAVTETTLIEISASTSTSAFKKDSGSLSSELLFLLRRRLQSQIWLTGARMIKIEVDECIERAYAASAGTYENWQVWGTGTDVSSKNLQHVHSVAAMLLSAWDSQRALLKSSTSAVNTVLFADFKRSAGMVGSMEPEGPNTALKVLCDAGIVLAWPLKEHLSFPERLRSKLPEALHGLLYSVPGAYPPNFQNLRDLVRDSVEVHFVLIEDLLLLRRIAVAPDVHTFQLLASSARFYRLRAAHDSLRTRLPSFAQLAERFGDVGRSRYLTAVANLLIARVQEGLLSTDSLGQPLL